MLNLALPHRWLPVEVLEGKDSVLSKGQASESLAMLQ